MYRYYHLTRGALSGHTGVVSRVPALFSKLIFSFHHVKTAKQIIAILHESFLSFRCAGFRHQDFYQLTKAIVSSPQTKHTFSN